MTYVNNETLDRDLNELVEDWDLENYKSTRNVRPGEWDETFNLQDLEYIYDHNDITQ
jgi:hypothetical protein